VFGSDRAAPAGAPNRTVGSFTALRSSSSHVSREPNRCRAQGYRGGPALLRCTYQSRLCEMCGPRHLLPRSSPGPLCRPVQEKVSRQTAPSTGTNTHTHVHTTHRHAAGPRKSAGNAGQPTRLCESRGVPPRRLDEFSGRGGCSGLELYSQSFAEGAAWRWTHHWRTAGALARSGCWSPRERAAPNLGAALDRRSSLPLAYLKSLAPSQPVLCPVLL
jgi:hypothetical protein